MHFCGFFLSVFDKIKVYQNAKERAMKNAILLRAKLCDFRNELVLSEKSPATVSKYLHDVQLFCDFAGEEVLEKQLVLSYKNYLSQRYAVSGANSMLAALNAFFKFCGLYELCVKQFRVQREAFCAAEKELTKAEYARLLSTARSRGNERLYLTIETLCGTGIRVSELKYVTVEALEKGEARVDCKGKIRRIFIVPELARRLRRYCRERGITQGSVFLSRNGRPLSRTAIWRDMKALCNSAGVSPAKVFPHNLRHLFARTFYGIEKDIVKLADILGHASINTTRIYVITTAAEHKRKMQGMHLIL